MEKRAIDFEILQLSDLDPEKDIILAYVDVGKTPNGRAKTILQNAKDQFGPMIKEKGFDILFISKRDNTPAVKVKPVRKSDGKKYKVDEKVRGYARQLIKKG